MEDLIMFKALNGEEIIARLIEETDAEYTVERARVLSMQNVGNGQVTIAMIPWFLGAPEGTVDVQKEHVFARLKNIPAELAKGYKAQTSPIALV